MSTTAQQMRAWRGPALLSFGFRPFFLGASIWAALAMALWVAMLLGFITLPTAFDPVSWHAHEFLYGYLGAVIAGFLLTAVPNWTGRLPIVGWPLAGLFALWLAGRVAVATSLAFPSLPVALVDLALPLALGAALVREIIAGRNWRNLIVLVLLACFATGNAMFHWEAAHVRYAAQGYGLRLGLCSAMLMIGVIGGRIVPSFTRNWLVRENPGRLPAPPMQRFDKFALALLLAGALLWVLAPKATTTGATLIGVGAVHAIRLARWAGHRTRREPLLWVLHVGYAFVPLGAGALGVSVLWPGLAIDAAGQHLWMAGAIGMMTLAVMSRATLGHTGQELSAGPGTLLLYAAMLVAVSARLGAGAWPQAREVLYTVAATAWIAAFGGFALLYGPLLLRARR
ncbi:MAG: NnrS family protein [Proteobacteria bacterium]|nr:NnrS family protein [Pseudomonadota bacterium]